MAGSIKEAAMVMQLWLSRKGRNEMAHLGLSWGYGLTLGKVITAIRANDHESFPLIGG
jgi:hypothetical protein